jgi:mono/diheme cytochrome c family protein
MRTRGAFFLLVTAGVAPLAAQDAAAAPDGASFYLQQHQTPEAAAAAIVAYVKQPDSTRSALPAHAIARFGLMPSQAHLTDAQLAAVASYVLTLADTTHRMPMGPPGAP